MAMSTYLVSPMAVFITTAELGYSSDRMTCKAESIEYLTLLKMFADF